MKIKRIISKILDVRPFELLTWLYDVLVLDISVKWILMAGALAAAGYGLWAARPIIRDAVLVVYAHQRAGEPIPFGPDYTMAMPYPAAQTYGIMVNSPWLIEKITYIVPFFATDRVAAETIYPEGAGFFPRVGVSSFTIGGQAYTEEGIISINERYLTDPQWIDEAGAFATLVHELIHFQGGAFLSTDSNPLVTSAEESFTIESNTSAATTEILAGMCNLRNKLACAAFWGEIESHAAAGLNTRLPENVYDAFMALFVRDADEERADRKTDRFWTGHEAERQGIRMRYGRYPWEQLVIRGLQGHTLDTGLVAGGQETGHFFRLLMPFDDTFDMLGWRMNVLIWLTSTGSN